MCVGKGDRGAPRQRKKPGRPDAWPDGGAALDGTRAGTRYAGADAAMADGLLGHRSGPGTLHAGAPPEPAGHDRPKYSSGHPVVRWLLARWLRQIGGQLPPAHLLVDVGAGKGITTETIAAAAVLVVALDHRRDKLLEARRRLPGAALVQADAAFLPFRNGSAPTVACVEVLDHLTNPELAVAELSRITQGRCVVSVAWEPWFRLGSLLRGKHFRRFGHNPKHVQQYRPASLRALLSTDFTYVRVGRCFPWLVAVAQGGSLADPAGSARRDSSLRDA